MVISEDLLWDAEEKGTPTVSRLRRTAVTAGCVGLFVLVLWTASDATWAAWAAAAYVLAEIAYRVWDRRRLVEARIVVGEADGRARLRLRQAGGRTTEHDPHQVARVLIIRDNVVDSANLRLRLHGKRVLFGRPGRPPAVTTWRRTCPRAHVHERNAWWGMPGVPD
ncbi:hypothetical protein STRCI_000110 [Streptomyces cinnabarinus]|uniref:DUF2244 domain-containing protein n=1 Tax=Streptomyces cinnabarinus TaxID=67287 RepID=A0ABY7K652_9ACTN|nr:hypothetical protein [Streptomyces cinnabarinus]WAZ19085.1 hypothetical protein STRCI_000110 [Streptomyces cinnabarinus]